MTSTVALDRLYISELNVRKTDRAIDIEQLADDIAAKGLLQNLVVVPDEARRGKYGVVAGGRRLLALQLLVERGTIPADKPIPVVHEKREDGREVSLSENLHRVDMNPVDEFEAFAAIIDSYEAGGVADLRARIDRCAIHFGETVRYIEQRLRLAALAPPILDALRARAITLDSAKAYAAYPDQALQMQVFQAQKYSKLGNPHSVHAIRAGLAGRVYGLDDRRVRYVGFDAYMAHGGRVERELFMGADDRDVVVDTALIDRLCAARAQEEADTIARAAGYAVAAVAAWPRVNMVAPKGFMHVVGIDLSFACAEERADAVLICELDEAGTLAPTGNGFVPVRARALTSYLERGAPTTGALASAPAPARRLESDIERLARIRREEIESRALRLAARPLLLELPKGRVVWPLNHRGDVSPIQRDEAGNTVGIAAFILIEPGELDAVRAKAERQFDEEESVRAAGTAGLATRTDLAAPADIAMAPHPTGLPSWLARPPMFDDAAHAEDRAAELEHAQ